MGCRGRFRYALARYSAHAWLLLVLPDLVRTSVLSPTHEHHHQFKSFLSSLLCRAPEYHSSDHYTIWTLYFNPRGPRTRASEYTKKEKGTSLRFVFSKLLDLLITLSLQLA